MDISSFFRSKKSGVSEADFTNKISQYLFNIAAYFIVIWMVVLIMGCRLGFWRSVESGNQTEIRQVHEKLQHMVFRGKGIVFTISILKQSLVVTTSELRSAAYANEWRDFGGIIV